MSCLAARKPFYLFWAMASAVMAFCISSCSPRLSRSELYELQAKCASTAAKLYKDGVGSQIQEDESGKSVGEYRNHYDENTNKCYSLEKIERFYTVERPELDNNQVLTSDYILNLRDVNENNVIGSYSTIDHASKKTLPVCYLKDVKCKSEEEFNKLIDLYVGQAF